MGWLQGIVTNPGVVLQNTIQPVADDPCLTLRPFSDAQASAVLRVQNAAGGVDHLLIDRAGAVATPHATLGALLPVGVAAGKLEIFSTYNDTDQTVNSVIEMVGSTGPSNNSGRYFASELVFQANNPAALTPTVELWHVGHEGSLQDDGTLAQCDFYISSAEGISRFLIEGPSGTEHRFRMGYSGFGGWDGQVGIYPEAEGTKGLTIRRKSNTSTGNQQEWQDESAVAQTIVAPNGRDWILDPTIGTMWATATNQRQGWWGATPVVQQANASAAGVSGIAAGALYAQADMVAVKAALTAIRSLLATTGLGANTA